MTATSTVTTTRRFHTLNIDGTAHCHGFAPDLEYGHRTIGAIYDLEPTALVERTLYATCLPLGDNRWLVTLGRFDDFFLSTLQVVVDHEPHELDPNVLSMLRGLVRIQCPTGHDYAGLQRWLARCGRQDLACDVGLLAAPPLFGAMIGFHRSERDSLGLFRDDCVSFAALGVMFALAADGDPEAGRRLREIGATNLLSCLALSMDVREAASAEAVPARRAVGAVHSEMVVG